MSFLHALQPASPPAAGFRRKLVPAALAMPLLMAACGGDKDAVRNGRPALPIERMAVAQAGHHAVAVQHLQRDVDVGIGLGKGTQARMLVRDLPGELKVWTALEALGMAKLIDLQPVRATMLKTKTDTAVRFIGDSL